MPYVIINDAQTYKFAELVKTDKKTLKITFISDKIQKTIKPSQLIYTIKSNNININQFIQDINKIINTIDAELLTAILENSYTPKSFNELANIYFGETIDEKHLIAILLKIATENFLFNDHQNGSFSKTTKEQQQILYYEQLQKEQEKNTYLLTYNQLINFIAPNFTQDIIKILNKPDKKKPEVQALFDASKYLNLTPLELCLKIRLINKVEDYFLTSFINTMFPKGINYSFKHLNNITDYPLENNFKLKTFSIDSKDTTEIDDAFSVESYEHGYRIGIHIAAPSLNNNLQSLVIENLSTIYYPNGKITMFPENIINQFSLLQDTIKPCVSLYFNLDLEYNIKEYSSKVENIKINSNLFLEDLEQFVQNNVLIFDKNFDYATEIVILNNFANKLETIRGKPSINNLVPEYSFKIINDEVIIIPRNRGNPIDKLVSELMILANCTWGRILTNNFIPAIYRVKQPNFPVKMTLEPESHTGLNVNYYTWATSPIRRGIDFINQHQIISLIFKTKDYFKTDNPILLNLLDNFDIRYAEYLAFQNKMERYFSLKYLIQKNITCTNATIVYKTKAQIDNVPIEIDTHNLMVNKPKGSTIKIKITNINLTSLEFEFKILE